MSSRDQSETLQIHVVDSHTAGEPTRTVVSGGPTLSGATVAEKQVDFRDHNDHFRRAIVCEPRGSDVLVGALLCEPSDPQCDAGVIFFNNVGFLGMCGHGMIGVLETLRYLGRIGLGTCRIETSVGLVEGLVEESRISITNVQSFRHLKDVVVEVPEVGRVVGDVAWGGNWFFLVRQPGFEISLAAVSELQAAAAAIREAVNLQCCPEVDHVELFSESGTDSADSKNFVLCPGLEYDRSPCGTGTSAKLACLAADGKLEPGQVWTQAGVLGTTFEAQFEWSSVTEEPRFGLKAAESIGKRTAGVMPITPRITAQAYVTGDSKLILCPTDPFCWGIHGDAG